MGGCNSGVKAMGRGGYLIRLVEYVLDWVASLGYLFVVCGTAVPMLAKSVALCP